MGNAFSPANAHQMGLRTTAYLDMLDEPRRMFDQASAVSWGAILAGAAAAAALSLVLLMLGMGLGLSFVSPWAYGGMRAAALGVSAIAWIAFTQLAASGMGGYLTGRLRSRWVAVHGDEVHFRDTAHGFLAWAIASLLTAGMLGSAIGSITGGGAHLAGSTAGNTAPVTAVGALTAGSRTAGSLDLDSRIAYFTDALFRQDAGAGASVPGNGNSNSAALAGGASSTAYVPGGGGSSEISRIFATGLQNGNLPVADARYVGQLVAQRTGLAQAEAERRVIATYNRLQMTLRQAKANAAAAAEEARETAAATSLWIFITLLTGAFVASLTATYGGCQRDN